jgi:hypothetical protein
MKARPNLAKYFPDERDWLTLDRKWICDVLFSLDEPGIDKMIKDAKANRKFKLEEHQDLIVEMRPEFAVALKNCQSFSSMLIYPIILL